LEANLRTQASELEIESNVIFAGKCQRNTVFEILSITDVFVLSSLWEGFGMVLAEAMAMEKPVVTTNTDGSQVLVEHNINGLVVQPRNPHLFSDALMNLIISPERRRKMGELGKKKISNFFSVDMYIQKHEDFYKKVIQAS
jgi:glycosyltransferase involved in cell wall biosynthesis